MNTKFFSRLEVIHHMSTSLVSDFVEEVKGGRRSCVAAFSHNWTSIKIQLKLLLNQLYCSFPALTQWWQWMALRSKLQGRHFYINQSSVLAGVTRRLYRPGPAFARKRGPGPWRADRAETPGPRVRGGGRAWRSSASDHRSLRRAQPRSAEIQILLTTTTYSPASGMIQRYNL